VQVVSCAATVAAAAAHAGVPVVLGVLTCDTMEQVGAAVVWRGLHVLADRVKVSLRDEC
jgi:6,7-dimethyl-8-ribityllumazine synthase